MSQRIYPSCHILEMFMPYLRDEKRLLDVLEKVAAKEFYRHVELPTFADAENRRAVRRLLEENHLAALTYVAPYFNADGLALCDLDGRGLPHLRRSERTGPRAGPACRCHEV